MGAQVYYMLSHARRARKIRDIVLVRIEQIAPLAFDVLINTIQVSVGRA